MFTIYVIWFNTSGLSHQKVHYHCQSIPWPTCNSVASNSEIIYSP